MNNADIIGAVAAFLTTVSFVPQAAKVLRTRETEAGIDWQTRITHPAGLATDMYGVAGLKHAMDINGYYGGPPRLPFAPLNPAQKLEVEDAFRDLKS